MSSTDLAEDGFAEGAQSAAGRSTRPLRIPAWPRRSVHGAAACPELPTSRALLFTLQWLCVGLVGLLCHMVLVREVGSGCFFILMAALLLLHRHNPLAGFIVYLQILLYQNVVMSLFTSGMTASEYTLLSGTSFIGGMMLVSGPALRMLLTPRPFKAGHRGVVETTRYVSIAIAAAVIYTAYGAIVAAPTSAVVGFRNATAILFAVIIGLVIGDLWGHRTVAICFLASAAVGVLLSLIEIADPVWYLTLIHAADFGNLKNSLGHGIGFALVIAAAFVTLLRSGPFGMKWRRPRTIDIVFVGFGTGLVNGVFQEEAYPHLRRRFAGPILRRPGREWAALVGVARCERALAIMGGTRSFPRRWGGFYSRLLLAAAVAAGSGFPALARTKLQPNPGPKSPALSACVKKVDAAHPKHDEGKSAPAPDRLQALSKGVNLTDIFRPSVSMATLGQDVARLRSLGLRHARIPLDPAWVIAWPADGKPDARLARLDDTVCLALLSGLAVILDVHPEGSLALQDAAPPDTVDALALAWDRLGARYAAFTPDLVFFEALNEPALRNAARWDLAQQVLLAHIRKAAPHHTILLTATPESTAGALAGLSPVDDANVAYVFHFYSPMVFTHQGADWASPEFGSIRGLFYPAEPGNAVAVRDRAVAADAKPLANYMASYGNADAIRAEIDVAARWAASHDVHLVATEFGVYGAAVPQSSRLSWLRDVRMALEAHSVGWTVWEYRGGFGIDDELGQGCGSAQSVGSALGLCQFSNAQNRQ